MKQPNITVYPLIAAGVAAAAFFAVIHHREKVRAAPLPDVLQQTPAPIGIADTPVPPPLPVLSSPFSAPIEGAPARVTKKAFGLYVTPKKSPVMPERFQGYHTGVDFETTPDEQAIDVPIRAACDGPLLLKEWATGYGGVAVQACKLSGQDVTVVYGHLRLSSITTSAHQMLKQGEPLGVLGKGYSTETNGERKHLHLGIHKGTSINIKGYVQQQAELDQWIDAMTLLRP